MTLNLQLTLVDLQLDRAVGLSMLILASAIFLYYTIWTLLLVRCHSMFDVKLDTSFADYARLPAIR